MQTFLDSTDLGIEIWGLGLKVYRAQLLQASQKQTLKLYDAWKPADMNLADSEILLVTSRLLSGLWVLLGCVALEGARAKLQQSDAWVIHALFRTDTPSCNSQKPERTPGRSII